MKKIIKENKIAGGIIFVLLVILAIVYFDKQPTVIQNQTGNMNLQQQQVSDFINNLPIGDINSQKCNELVDAKNTDLTLVYQSVANNMCQSATPQNKERYCKQINDLLDSKYLYSHRLCLAEIHIITMTGMNDFQIIDLGSNDVFAEKISIENRDSYYLYNQKQNNPIDLSDIWSKIQVMP